MKLVSIGKIINVRGLKGELKVKSLTDFSSLRYKKGNELYIENEDTGEKNTYKVDSHSKSGDFDYVHFSGITTIDDAQKFKNCYIKISIDKLPSLKENQFYFYQLIGLKVFTDNNQLIGEVIEIINNGAQHIIKVRDKNQKNVLIPFVKAFINNVDLENKIIIINKIEGLLNDEDWYINSFSGNV